MTKDNVVSRYFIKFFYCLCTFVEVVTRSYPHDNLNHCLVKKETRLERVRNILTNVGTGDRKFTVHKGR